MEISGGDSVDSSEDSEDSEEPLPFSKEGWSGGGSCAVGVNFCNFHGN